MRQLWTPGGAGFGTALGLFLVGTPAVAQAPLVIEAQRNTVTLELAAPATVVALAVSDFGDVLLLNADELARTTPRTGRAIVRLDYSKGVWLRGGPRLRVPPSNASQLECPSLSDDEYRRHLIAPRLSEDKPTPTLPPASTGCQWLVGPDRSRVAEPTMRHLILAVAGGDVEPFPLDSALARLDLRDRVPSDSVAAAVAGALGAAGQGRDWWTWSRTIGRSLRGSKTMVRCGWRWVGDCPHNGPMSR
ncbi:MAG: hypothetical protein AB7L66_14495 [Gemmatimonadales bacterium]